MWLLKRTACVEVRSSIPLLETRRGIKPLFRSHGTGTAQLRQLYKLMILGLIKGRKFRSEVSVRPNGIRERIWRRRRTILSAGMSRR